MFKLLKHTHFTENKINKTLKPQQKIIFLPLKMYFFIQFNMTKIHSSITKAQRVPNNKHIK